MSAVRELLTVVGDFKKEFKDEFIQRVKRRTPVSNHPLTAGTLQRGWDGEVLSDAIEITNEVEYASFVEYGTRHMSPRRMLGLTILEADLIADIAARKVRQ